MKRSNKARRRMIAFLLALTMCLSLAGCGSAMSTFKSHVKNGDYADAVACYRDKISGHIREEEEAEDFLLSYLDSQLDAYASGSLSSSDYEISLKTMQHISDELYILENELLDAEDFYYNLSSSKQAYQEAVSNLEDGHYLDAIYAFSYVSNQDTEHYADAQKKLSDALSKYENEQLSLIEAVKDELNPDSDSYDAYAWLDMGTHIPEAQETCNRLLSVSAGYVHLAQCAELPRSRIKEYYDISSLAELETGIEIELKRLSEDYYGYDSALDWIDIEFNQEITSKFNSYGLN